jgi:hypothetical protein
MSDTFNHEADAWEDLERRDFEDDSPFGTPLPLPPKNLGKVEVVVETHKAFLVRLFPASEPIWFPKSYVRLTPESELIVAHWLYMRKLSEIHK